MDPLVSVPIACYSSVTRYSVARLPPHTTSTSFPFTLTYLPAAVSALTRKPAAVFAIVGIFTTVFPTLPAAGSFSAFVFDTMQFALDHLLAAVSA